MLTLQTMLRAMRQAYSYGDTCSHSFGESAMPDDIEQQHAHAMCAPERKASEKKEENKKGRP